MHNSLGTFSYDMDRVRLSNGAILDADERDPEVFDRLAIIKTVATSSLIVVAICTDGFGNQPSLFEENYAH